MRDASNIQILSVISWLLKDTYWENRIVLCAYLLSFPSFFADNLTIHQVYWTVSEDVIVSKSYPRYLAFLFRDFGSSWHYSSIEDKKMEKWKLDHSAAVVLESVIYPKPKI